MAGVPDPPDEARDIFGPALPKACAYARLLAGAGAERGLIGPAEAPRIWERHLLNSAVVAELIPNESLVVDLGSGAGLPGIVLALLLPGVRFVLLEPMARRTAFLTECVRELGLPNVAVQRGRAEELAGQIQADVVTARAVAALERLAGLALGLTKPGGRVLAVKGAAAAAELARAKPALRALGVVDAEVLTVGAGGISTPVHIVSFTAPRQPVAAAHRGGSRSRGSRSARR